MAEGTEACPVPKDTHKHVFPARDPSPSYKESHCRQLRNKIDQCERSSRMLLSVERKYILVLNNLKGRAGHTYSPQSHVCFPRGNCSFRFLWDSLTVARQSTLESIFNTGHLLTCALFCSCDSSLEISAYGIVSGGLAFTAT